MAQTILITLITAGTDTGPFNLYSNVDGFTVPFEVAIPKPTLVAGYLSTMVPDGATVIRIKSENVLCSNYIDVNITGGTTTTTTTHSTTTTTTTILCANFTLFGGSGLGRTFNYTDCAGNSQSTFVPTNDSIDVCIRLPYFAIGATNTGPC